MSSKRKVKPMSVKLSVLALLAAVAAAPLTAAERTSAEDIEQRLDAARQRLDEAAREVAELTTQLGAPIFDQFLAFGEGPHRAIIGVQLDPKSDKDGARILEVSPGGPADEAGLRRGDVIVALDGKELKGGESAARELTARLNAVEPDTKVKLRYRRDGKTLEADVVTRAAFFGPFAMRALPFPPEIQALPGLPMHPRDHLHFRHAMRSELAGMELATLTPELGRYFGTQQGVLVVRAPDGEAFRLEDGDVIVSVDGREPKSGSHLTRILSSYQPGEKLKLRVLRQKKSLDLEVTLPEGRVRPQQATGAKGTEEKV